jgi:GMP synthase (glutamine-hydrolysing)
MNIHFLQHLPFEDAAGIRAWMDSRGHRFSRTAFFENDPFPTLDSFDWLVVLGGFMNIYEHEHYPWLIDEKRFIGEAINAGKVVIGICLGAQLIADVLGGPVTQGAHKEIGWHPVRRTPDSTRSNVFSALPEEFMAFHWHGDTFAIPPDSIHTVESTACSNQAFSYDDRVIGLQFHLESTQESVENLILNCSNELVEAPYIQSPTAMRGNFGRLGALNTLMNTLLDSVAAANPRQQPLKNQSSL